ncbi:hypothetical protein DSO57_1019442 [Entomophthora muscae]|uniref:Uncharacterized protein n=1 Tax=Entomophthora muscae TaxID=34485 RepID=A0ACC2RUZ6_9FUNG|nr:hypothetical protein DSO57_1019442 [Entomophthora muscae]
MKGDLNTLFDGFEGKFFPTGDSSIGSSWSSSTTILISTSPEGVTTTRKTVRRSDGSEEFTETITHPSGISPQREEESLLMTSKTSDQFKPSNLLDSVSKWWHDLSL